MRRLTAAAVVLVTTLTLGLSACGGSEETPAGSANITFWTGFTDRELGVMKDVVADF